VPLVLLDDDPVELGVDELEPLELGLELVDELLSVDDEPELDDDAGGVVGDGGVAVDGDDGLEGGEADGVPPPGRSLVRSVRLSLQAVSSPALSATASTAVRNFFISMPPPSGVARPMSETATAMPLPRTLTGRSTTITNAGDPPGCKGDAR
jgi:hypothetical protein